MDSTIARWAGRISSVLALVALSGCTRDEAKQRDAGAPHAAADVPSRAEIVAAPDGGDEVSATVAREVARARKDGRELLVYVGAPWCEPCTRFHKAVEAGELDKAFPTLRLIEFDLDRDRDRLERAGYASKYIPLFVVPTASGEASPLRIEGSIKGEGAVPEITPRLVALLAQARAADARR